MKHPLAFLLRVGRSDDERLSLLGDLDEERRARVARGGTRLMAFAWYTAEILRAFLWGLRDAVTRTTTQLARRTTHPARRTTHHAPRTFFVSWPDIKLGLRLLIRNPGLTAVSTVGITVGIAIAAGAFGFIHASFDPPLPLDDGDRIVALENWDVVGNNENRHSLHDFVTWRDQMTSVVEISAFREASATLRAGDRVPETVRIAAMSASGFRVARVPPLVGRLLNAEDEREAAPPVVVIGYTVWQSRFAQDRSVIGSRSVSATCNTPSSASCPNGSRFR